MDIINNDDKKNIIIFVSQNLLVGGIETYVYKLAKEVQKKGWQIIWIKRFPGYLDESFSDVFESDSTLVWDNAYDYEKLRELTADSNAEIRIITFDICRFAQAEIFKSNFKECRVHNFYFVPHFAGDTLYLEEPYKGKKREKVRKKMSDIVKKMHNGNNIRYFSIKHIDKMTSEYGYREDNMNYVMVPPLDSGNVSFDRKRCMELATSGRFNILTVSRFEFPHKGYVLGLIKAYAELKNKYPHIELTIVGYGVDESKVHEALNSLSENYKKDVHFIGKVHPEKLVDYYNDANINISVAGCCSQGAKNGTLSIPARHYDYNCEVYGFLPESKPFVVSEKKGEPVIDYIEQVINMSPDEYCKKCEMAFHSFRSDSESLRVKIEDLEDKSENIILSDKDIRFIKKEEKRRVIRGKLRSLKRKLTKRAD